MLGRCACVPPVSCHGRGCPLLPPPVPAAQPLGWWSRCAAGLRCGAGLCPPAPPAPAAAGLLLLALVPAASCNTLAIRSHALAWEWTEVLVGLPAARPASALNSMQQGQGFGCTCSAGEAADTLCTRTQGYVAVLKAAVLKNHLIGASAGPITAALCPIDAVSERAALLAPALNRTG